ncbi:MAG: Uma2 family endonuclease, partial [Chloroflexi bacterium]|nr:Uma2 family endonuclease [Chloroflexota bacterium]
YREPTPQGYASTQVLAPGESISPLAFPALQMSVGMVFGR